MGFAHNNGEFIFSLLNLQLNFYHQSFMLTISARIGNATYAPGLISLDENFVDATLARQKPPLLAFVLSHSSVPLFVPKQSVTTAKFVKDVDSR